MLSCVAFCWLIKHDTSGFSYNEKRICLFFILVGSRWVGGLVRYCFGSHVGRVSGLTLDSSIDIA